MPLRKDVVDDYDDDDCGGCSGPPALGNRIKFKRASELVSFRSVNWRSPINVCRSESGAEENPSSSFPSRVANRFMYDKLQDIFICLQY